MKAFAKVLGLACLLMAGSVFANDNMVRSTTVQQKKAEANAKLAKDKQTQENNQATQPVAKEGMEKHHRHHHAHHHHHHHVVHERVVNPHAFRRIMGNH